VATTEKSARRYTDGTRRLFLPGLGKTQQNDCTGE
jgi:hypothetical protein